MGDETLPGLLQHWRQLFERALDTDAVLGAELIHFAVIDETVRPSNAHDRRLYLQFAQSFEYRAAESAHQDVIFESNDDADAARVLGKQFAVQRLNKAGINDGCRKSLPAKF